MGVHVKAFEWTDPDWDPKVSGMFEMVDDQPTIHYNSADGQNRIRFTIAHELGHYVLKHGKRFRDTSAMFAGGTYDPYEVAANRFAAELLMPVYPVKVLLEDHGITSISQLALAFQVSEPAMTYRLKNLGYLR